MLKEDCTILILGCGYTGRRVARLLLDKGIPVLATTRETNQLQPLARLGLTVRRMDVTEPDTLSSLELEEQSRPLLVLHSIPVIRTESGLLDPTPTLLEALGSRPSRMLYLSTTGVYGSTMDVNEDTAAGSKSPTAALRLQAENQVMSGSWSGLVLRPAAIYGPGRGVHESMRAGKFRLVGDGGNFVSRIHVDDLAAISAAALLSEVTGVYPVADEEPCTSATMARFCAGRLSVPMPPSAPAERMHHTRLANRRVDGSAILRRLGIRLQYPSYRVGVPASLSAAEHE
jgi:nucleoside-diphosphate-sugar epimerase